VLKVSEIWFRSNSRTHRFLSNFWHCKIRVWGLDFPSAEHAYQAAKTWPKERTRFINGTPLQAKRLGRQVERQPNFQPELAMYQVLRAKFEQHPDLRKLLLDTADSQLIEDNTGPWGGRNGAENRLGKLLMTIREELKC
jgi:N-glycosidase YbiA